ncbi:ribonuclease HII [Deinococcus yavapaiensis]|uniref:ribonuclease HII n=1 Tax=Deinococcus yavapaiensis TaxID=309889 RepID=UPI000DA1AE54|nr:ribonuclease HII [Deinococcus yavapaiensis]
MVPHFDLERSFWDQGLTLVAGVDEAGRGAWAGPVAVSALILPALSESFPFRDSKTLSAARREQLAEIARSVAVAWTVEFASASEVDAKGVLNATKAAASRAIARLEPAPQALVTDYLKLDTTLPFLAPPKADRDSFSVAAASLLAKTARDAYMTTLDDAFPGYGFAAHKGYGVNAHRAALLDLGPCAEHRRSFAPVAHALQARLLRAPALLSEAKR